MRYFQQGDVLIKPIKHIPIEARRYGRHGNGVLAQGEATGHTHFASGENVTTWTHQGMTFLDAPNGAQVRHEEHLPIEVPPGIYKIEIVREFDHFSEEERFVSD